MYFGRSKILQQCLSKRRGHAKRRDGIKDLSQRRVLSTHRLESKPWNSSVNEASCDVLWSTAVECNEVVRDVYWGCLASWDYMVCWPTTVLWKLETAGHLKIADTISEVLVELHLYEIRTCGSRVFHPTTQASER
jgi:hypothetical protein